MAQRLISSACSNLQKAEQNAEYVEVKIAQTTSCKKQNKNVNSAETGEAPEVKTPVQEPAVENHTNQLLLLLNKSTVRKQARRMKHLMILICEDGQENNKGIEIAKASEVRNQRNSNWNNNKKNKKERTP